VRRPIDNFSNKPSAKVQLKRIFISLICGGLMTWGASYTWQDYQQSTARPDTADKEIEANDE